MNSRLHARATELFLVAVGLPDGERGAFVEQACGSDGQLRVAVLELLAHDAAGDGFLDKSVHDTAGVGRTLADAVRQREQDAGRENGHDAPARERAGRDRDRPGAEPSDAPADGDTAHGERVAREAARPAEASPLSRLLPSDDTTDDLASLGGYTVERRIGEGGMGLVYQARRPGSAQPVAIKVLRPELATTAFVQRLEAEAWALSQLEHPGIARLLDSGTWPTADGLRPYLVMELVRGRPLTAWARECGADVRSRLEVLARLCDAVHHAHLRGVIHRDLKPANVLVTEEGRPKILDFGIARLADRPAGLHTVATDLGRFVGTLAYMSPEQVRQGPHEADMRADVYALGVMAYELLAGRLPVDVNRMSVAQAVHAITGATPVPLGRVRRELRGDVEMIVAKAMHVDRAKRYGTAAALADDIRRHLSGQPVEARPPTAWELVRRAVREHPWAVGACTVVLAALCTGLVLQSAANRRLAADKLWMTDLIGGIMGFLTTHVPAQEPAAPRLTELLLHADTYMQADMAHRPDLEGALRVVLGRTLAHRGDGQYDPLARAHLARGIELLDEAFGPEDARTIEGRIQLAAIVIGRPDTPRDVVEEAARELQARVGEGTTPEQRVRVAQLLAEADAALGHEADALRELQNILVEARLDPGVEHEATQRLMGSLVRRLPTAQAVELAEELVDVRTRALGADHSQTIWAHGLLGRAHRSRAQTVAPEDPVLAEAHFEESERLIRALRDGYRDRLGDRHLAVWNADIALAWLLNSRGKHDEALTLFENVAQEYALAFGPKARRSLSALTSVGEVARRAGDFERAERIFRAVLDQLPDSDMDDARNWGIQRIALGQVLTDQGRYDEAEVELLRAARDWDGKVDEPEAHLKLHRVLQRLYADSGQPDLAQRHEEEAGRFKTMIVK